MGPSSMFDLESSSQDVQLPGGQREICGWSRRTDPGGSKSFDNVKYILMASIRHSRITYHSPQKLGVFWIPPNRSPGRSRVNLIVDFLPPCVLSVRVDNREYCPLRCVASWLEWLLSSATLLCCTVGCDCAIL